MEEVFNLEKKERRKKKNKNPLHPQQKKLTNSLTKYLFLHQTFSRFKKKYKYFQLEIQSIVNKLCKKNTPKIVLI